MTTTVTINAHCDNKTTKVKIKTDDKNNPQPDVFIEDNEEYQVVVYDDRTITVSEVSK